MVSRASMGTPSLVRSWVISTLFVGGHGLLGIAQPGAGWAYCLPANLPSDAVSIRRAHRPCLLSCGPGRVSRPCHGSEPLRGAAAAHRRLLGLLCQGVPRST